MKIKIEKEMNLPELIHGLGITPSYQVIKDSIQMMLSATVL